MSNVAAVVAACANSGVNAKKKTDTHGPIRAYVPEPKPEPKVGGMIIIRSDRNIFVRQDVIADSAEVRFSGSAAVDCLIERLIRLRDDMIEKETEGE